MNLLWICQKLPPEADALIGGQKELKNTGGWILGMAGEIIKYDDVQLAILASSPLVDSLRVLEGEKLRYYVLPEPKGESDKKFLDSLFLMLSIYMVLNMWKDFYGYWLMVIHIPWLVCKEYLLLMLIIIIQA